MTEKFEAVTETAHTENKLCENNGVEPEVQATVDHIDQHIIDVLGSEAIEQIDELQAQWRRTRHLRRAEWSSPVIQASVVRTKPAISIPEQDRYWFGWDPLQWPLEPPK